ncbi:hypothetical protein [Tepidibacter sp. Z1-5]|uniref:hypothetical protein n=1 Tax=Tepidibacter sp. Z1-5 TaxID=3134138 RepID=UPI0030BCDDD4
MGKKTHCEECGTKLNALIRTTFRGKEVCGKCERELRQKMQMEQSEQQEITNTITTPSSKGKGSIDALRMFGIVELICSIIVAIIIFAQIGTTEGYYRDEINPIGLGASLTILIQGVLFYLVTSVLCNIGEDVIIIKNKLNKEEKETV